MKADGELQKAILCELHSEPDLGFSSTEIGVIVKEGAITLCGQLGSYAKVEAAVRAARRVDGVKVIALNIEVVHPGAHSGTNTDIGRGVNQALKWLLAMDEKRIEAKVEDGWVYLEGEVHKEEQKARVENTVEKIYGVKGIINLIHVKQKKNEEVDQLQESFFSAQSEIESVPENGEVVNKENSITNSPGVTPAATWPEKVINSNSGFAKVENPSKYNSRYGYCGLANPVNHLKPKRSFRR